MTRVDVFRGFVVEIEKRLRIATRSPVEAAIDDFELAGALDLLKRFLASGNVRDLNEGISRLNRVFARRSKVDRDWGTSSLARLRTIGEEMTKSDREAALNAKEEIATVQNVQKAPSEPAHCDLLVIAALYEPELSAFLRRISNVQEFIGDADSAFPSITYYRGTLERTQRDKAHLRNLSVVGIFQDRVGMADSAALITTALRVFRPAIIAMTGVCAGRADAGVRLCDLIVPSHVFTYDTGKYGEQGFQPEPFWTEAADRIWRRVVTVGDSIVQELRHEISSAYEANVYIPKLHTQIMACGSAVIDHEDVMKTIAGANRKVVGLDMESYAVLRAVRLCSPKTPVFVVKSVMDLGRRKRDRVKRKAAFWAASFLARFVAREFESVIPE